MLKIRRASLVLVPALAVSVALMVPTDARAQCEVDKVTASNADGDDRYGWSLAVNGDYAVVGSDRGDGGGSIPQPDTGAAYLLRRDGLNWVEIQHLVSDSSSAQGEAFGASVAISDNADLIVVGALNARGMDGTASAGTVYVFKRYEDSFACREDGDCTDVGLTTCTGDVCEGLTWVIETRLFADDPAAGVGFGFAVDMSGDVIVVGANRTDQGVDDSTGAAYVFRRDEDNGAWQFEQKLTASNASTFAFFGGSVSVEGNRIAVGAIGATDTVTVNRLGIAYIFEYDGATWNEVQTLAASDGVDADAFGHAVDLFGDTIVVTAMNADPNGVSAAGKAYVYRRAGGTFGDERILTASKGLPTDRFGRSASLHGDNLLIGARDTDDPGSRAGSAYLFTYDGADWIEIKVILAFDGASNDRFGHAVSLSETYGIVGAYREDDAGSDAGAAYVFALGLGHDCNENLIPDDCDVMDGTEPDTNNNGTPDPCECQSDGDCVGGGACSMAVCDRDRLCEVLIDPGTCLIDGACFADGEADPSNSCEICNASASQDSFTPFSGACEDDGNVCTIDVCVLGACTHLPVQVGTPCGDQDTDTDCDRSDSCDPAGECSPNFEPDGQLCTLETDDGNDCTEDQCQAGVCVSAGIVGRACGNQTETDCDKPDTCDAAGDCQANLQPDETACNDRLFCTGNDGCLAGICVGDEDAGPCSVPGQTCIEFTAECGCDAAVEDVCKDEDACTEDFCFFQRCRHDPIPGCCEVDEDCQHVGNECEETVCENNECTLRGLAAGIPCGDPTLSECDKADTCDGDGACLDNFESPGTGCTVAQIGNDTGDPDCDAANTCNDGGLCLANLASDGTPCADELRCDGEEICQAGLCLDGSPPCVAVCAEDPGGLNGFICLCTTEADCDDGFACTVDVCNTDLGACEFPIAAGSCLIDQACVDEGSENPTNECETCNTAQSNDSWTLKGDESACASDSNICTDDVCLSGVCSNRNNTAACSDGRLCTDGDVCAGGTCVGDLISCPTDQFCNPATGACVDCATDGDCEDDGNACTTESCVDQVCQRVDNTNTCDDGNLCTLEDACSAGNCAGTAKDCSAAGDQCKSGVCDAATGSCVGQATNEGAACNDGQFCSTGETCSSGNCTGGSATCPIGQSCDESNDRCFECQIAAECNDREPCTQDSCPNGFCEHDEILGCRTGACCLPAVCFDYVGPSDCELIGGAYIGTGLLCDGDPDFDDVFGCDDGCPLDANKDAPGVCGCGALDNDSDQDDIMDCNDACPELPGSIELNGCPRLGACCFEIGVCLDHRGPQDCADALGSFQGQGSVCGEDCDLRPDPSFIQPPAGVTTVGAGDTVHISFDAANDDDDNGVQWRLFYLAEADPRDLPADELGTELLTGSGNLGLFEWDTAAVAVGSYSLGLAATDSGSSIAQTVALGFDFLIVTIPNDDVSTPTIIIDTSCLEIQAVRPPNCAIDARQPSEITGPPVQGWNSIDVTVVPSGCTLRSGDLSVDSLPNGPAPTINNVSQAGDVATITFDSVIPVQNWTCVSLNSDTAQLACLGNLPCDVNSNGLSNPALDLVALIDCLNNPGKCEDWQENIDRTGEVAGVLDITRLIDLFNGAGSYDSWIGASMQGTECPSR